MQNTYNYKADAIIQCKIHKTIEQMQSVNAKYIKL